MTVLNCLFSNLVVATCAEKLQCTHSTASNNKKLNIFVILKLLQESETTFLLLHKSSYFNQRTDRDLSQRRPNRGGGRGGARLLGGADGYPPTAAPVRSGKESKLDQWLNVGVWFFV